MDLDLNNNAIDKLIVCVCRWCWKQCRWCCQVTLNLSSVSPWRDTGSSAPVSQARSKCGTQPPATWLSPSSGTSQSTRVMQPRLYLTQQDWHLCLFDEDPSIWSLGDFMIFLFFWTGRNWFGLKMEKTGNNNFPGYLTRVTQPRITQHICVLNTFVIIIYVQGVHKVFFYL